MSKRQKRKGKVIIPENDISLYIKPSLDGIITVKKYLYTLVPAIILFALLVLLTTFIQMVFIANNKGLDTNVAQVLPAKYFLTLQILMTIIACPILYKLGKNTYCHFRSEAFHVDINWKQTGFMCLMMIPFAFFAQSVLALEKYLPIFNNVNTSMFSTDNANIALIVVTIISTVVLPPLYEELYRFLTMKAFSQVTSNFVIINIIQSLLFALLHLSILTFIYTFLGGLLLGYILKMTQNIKSSILAHIVFNAVALIPLFNNMYVYIGSFVIFGGLTLFLIRNVSNIN